MGESNSMLPVALTVIRLFLYIVGILLVIPYDHDLFLPVYSKSSPIPARQDGNLFLPAH